MALRLRVWEIAMVLRNAAALAAALAVAVPALAAGPPVRMEIVSSPAAGEEATAPKGGAVASTNAMEAVDAIVTKNGYSADGLIVPPGRFSMWRVYQGGRLYQAHGSLHRDGPDGRSRLVVGGIFVPDGGKPPKLYWNDLLGPVFIEAPGLEFAQAPYRRDTLISAKSDLVYMGLQNGKPTFVYREFDGDLVRPARTEAGLGADKELETHGGRIRIVSATEQEIRYVVVKPLDAPVFERPPPPKPPPPEEDENEDGRRPATPPARSVPLGDQI
jgi:hypothetical protein